jgi:hypothetical protein
MIIWPAAPAARRRIETAFMLIVEAFLFENLCSELWIIRYVPDVSKDWGEEFRTASKMKGSSWISDMGAEGV